MQRQDKTGGNVGKKKDVQKQEKGKQKKSRLKLQAEKFYVKHPQMGRYILKEERVREVLSLYPGKSREEIGTAMFAELISRMAAALAAGIAVLALSLYAWFTRAEPERFVTRPAAGKAAAELKVEVETKEGWQTGTVSIGAHVYTEEEIEVMHMETEECLEQIFLGKNEDLLHVEYVLVFPDELKEPPARLVWESDRPDLVGVDGVVHNEELSGEENVTVSAKVFYGEEYRIFSRLVTVVPKRYTEEELVYRAAMDSLQEDECASREESRWELPETAAGMQVRRLEGQQVPMPVIAAGLAILLPVFLYSNYFSSLETKKKKRNEQAKKDYREFVTKLSLMMAAGLSTRAAWRRLTEEYQKKEKGQGRLAEELAVTERELENGRSETAAYEAFGERMGMISYQRLSSLLVQYVTKGVQGMRQMLLEEAKEVMAQEREQIRVRGEQAGTKLLLPMMGLLVLVFAILLVPAFRSF